MKPRDEWWPQDPDGPMPPLWWYVAQRWRWCVLVVCEIALIWPFWYYDAPSWVWPWLTAAIWSSNGWQWHAIWQSHAEHKAKMAALWARHEARMAIWDRRMDLLVEATENGYSQEWLKMRGLPDVPPPPP